MHHPTDRIGHTMAFVKALVGTRNSWRIDPTIHRTMSERSYHGAMSRSLSKLNVCGYRASSTLNVFSYCACFKHNSGWWVHPSSRILLIKWNFLWWLSYILPVTILGLILYAKLRDTFDWVWRYIYDIFLINATRCPWCVEFDKSTRLYSISKLQAWAVVMW